MATEYKIMMKKDGKWWKAHVNCHNARITTNYEDAVSELTRIIWRRNEWGCPADEYKIVKREVTDWVDA